MFPRFFFLLVYVLVFRCVLSAQPFASYSGNTLILDNGVVKRVVQMDTGQSGIVSASYTLKAGSGEFLYSGSEEFYFEANGKPVSGVDKWKLDSVQLIDLKNSGSGAVVILDHPMLPIQLRITYLLYPGLPLIRKNIGVLNKGIQKIKIESLDIESLNFDKSGFGTDCWIMHDYARYKSLGQFIGNWYDPVVVVHEANESRGFVLGNESPGVMKRTTAFLKPAQLTVGLTHSDQNFAFRKWLAPGEYWESPWVFTCIYENSDDPYAVLNEPVSNFVRHHLGTRLSKIPEKPAFVYNTWVPFEDNINEELIYELVDAASECGVQEFIIDDGWQDFYGDWNINKEKFPNGLKPVFDYIKSKGMKPGLWISLAIAESESAIFKKHQEWAVRGKNGLPINLHADVDQMYGRGSYSMCMASDWYDHIKKVILNLVREYGLEYLKGDFAVVTGAYTSDKTRSGCHSTIHPLHEDQNESLLELYGRIWQLFDDIHKEAPGVFIDCTFETMGELQLIDLDMCKHAEGNWLSNFYEKSPLGALRVRQMSWWRSPVIPATALLIGNQRLDDPNFELSFMSLAGSLPIFLGDLRLLSNEQRARIRLWADWMQSMQDKHDCLSFRQDLSGFGEPAEGSWDGYQRINSDTHSGGIIGIFRQGSSEIQRNVTIKFLHPDLIYEVKKAPEGVTIEIASGEELAQKGFNVRFEKKYDGAVYEVCEK
jgi:alpha-galactosidase